MSWKDPIDIKDAIKDLVKELGMQSSVDLIDIDKAWHSLLGDKVFEGTKMQSFKNGYLRVKVYSPILRHKLITDKNKLIYSLNKSLNKIVIKDIYFTI